MSAELEKGTERLQRLVLDGSGNTLVRFSFFLAIAVLIGLIVLAAATLLDITLRAFTAYTVRGLFELSGLFMAVIIVGFAVVLGFRALDAYEYGEKTMAVVFGSVVLSALLLVFFLTEDTSPSTQAGIGFLALYILIAAQIPIGVALALLGVSCLALTLGVEQSLVLAQNEVSRALTSVDMAAIPLFLLMGNFATWAGLSGDIFKAGTALVGSRRGGLAIASVAGCGGFGAISGSSRATTATFGKVAFVEMEKRNYAHSLAAGCIAAGGTLGALIPPSVVLIVYCVVVEESIQVAFQAALIPGLLALSMYVVAIMLAVRMKPDLAPTVETFDWPYARKALVQAWRPTLLFLLVLGGLYGGIFTTQEAASVGAILAFLFAITTTGFTWQKFKESLMDTALNAGAIYVIFIGANIFASFMSFSDVASLILELVNIDTTPHWLILLALVVIYLLLGTVFDTLAAVLVTTPLVVPLILGMDYDLIWWGVVTLSLVEIGMITPPLGMNVFVMRSVVGSRLELATIFKGVVPFLIADLVRVTLLVCFPIITLWLPSLLSS